jgi:hypothetical protein
VLDRAKNRSESAARATFGCVRSGAQDRLRAMLFTKICFASQGTSRTSNLKSLSALMIRSKLKSNFSFACLTMPVFFGRNTKFNATVAYGRGYGCKACLAM